MTMAACGAKDERVEVTYSEGHDFGTIDFGMNIMDIEDVYGLETDYQMKLDSSTDIVRYPCTFEGIPGKVEFFLKNDEIVNIFFRSDDNGSKTEQYEDKLLAYAKEHYEEDGKEGGETNFKGKASDGKKVTVSVGFYDEYNYAAMEMVYYPGK